MSKTLNQLFKFLTKRALTEEKSTSSWLLHAKKAPQEPLLNNEEAFEVAIVVAVAVVVVEVAVALLIEEMPLQLMNILKMLLPIIKTTVKEVNTPSHLPEVVVVEEEAEAVVAEEVVIEDHLLIVIIIITQPPEALTRIESNPLPRYS
jgi:hypothetical protein